MKHQFIFFIILFLILNINELYAQNCVIHGYVSLFDSAEREGIMIQLLDTPAIKLLQFRTTDSTGHFKFNAVKKGFYKIHVSQFGYNSIQVLLQCDQTDIDLKTLQLEALSVNLEEISVIDKVYRMKKSGDTTIFNIKAFETGSEQSVSDIIIKIPGFSMNGTQYFFQNKSIKKVLIDGKDIADENHVELTDALHYNRIQDIRIIENYHDYFQPYKENQKKEIALDIITNAKYKNKYQGTLNTNWGYKNIHDILGNIINTSDKNAFRIILRSSNTGKGLIENSVNNIVKEVENNKFFNGSHQLLSQMSADPNRDLEIGNYFNLNNHYAKIAYDAKYRKTHRLKSNLVIQTLTGTQDILSSRQFFSDISSIQDFYQLNKQNILMATLDNHLSFSISPSSNIELNIPIFFKADNLNTSEEGSLTNIPYKNENNHNTNQFSITPVYKFHKNFKNGITLSIAGKNKYIIDSGNLNIYSKDSIAGAFIFDAKKHLFQSSQINTYTSFNLNNQVRLRKKIRYFELQYNIAWQKNFENISNTSDYEFTSPFIGSEKLAFSSLTHSIMSIYDKKSFRLVFGLLYAHSSFNGISGTNKNDFFRPNILLMYRINSKWNISTSYTAKLYQPSIIQVNSLQTLHGQLNLWEGGLSIQDVGILETYNFSLFREFEIGEETTFFNATFSINPKSTEIHPVYGFESFFQIKSFQLLEKENQIRLQLFYSKKMEHWSYTLNIAGYKSTLNMDEGVIKDNNFTTDLVINYLKIKNIRVSSGVDIKISNRSNTFSKATNIHLRPRLSIALFRGMFQGRIWYQLMYNEISRSKNLYHVLNLEASRKKLMKNFELNIKVHDVLNIIPGTISLTTFNPIFIHTRTYKSFPGQVSLGLKWYFSPNNLYARE